MSISGTSPFQTLLRDNEVCDDLEVTHHVEDGEVDNEEEGADESFRTHVQEDAALLIATHIAQTQEWLDNEFGGIADLEP